MCSRDSNRVTKDLRSLDGTAVDKVDGYRL